MMSEQIAYFCLCIDQQTHTHTKGIGFFQLILYVLVSSFVNDPFPFPVPFLHIDSCWIQWFFIFRNGTVFHMKREIYFQCFDFLSFFILLSLELDHFLYWIDL